MAAGNRFATTDRPTRSESPPSNCLGFLQLVEQGLDGAGGHDVGTDVLQRHLLVVVGPLQVALQINHRPAVGLLLRRLLCPDSDHARLLLGTGTGQNLGHLLPKEEQDQPAGDDGQHQSGDEHGNGRGVGLLGYGFLGGLGGVLGGVLERLGNGLLCTVKCGSNLL